MQTQPERGNKKFGFLCQQSRIHKCQIMSTHTAMEQSHLTDIKSPVAHGKKPPKRSCLCRWSFHLLSSFLFYIRLFMSEFLGSLLLYPPVAAAHTLMGRVWLICCRTISWLLSGLLLLCPGSVPPSRSRSLPTQSHTGQQRVHSRFKHRMKLIITPLVAPSRLAKLWSISLRSLYT